MKWLIFLLLAGCAAPFEADNKRMAQATSTTWIVVEDAENFCYQLMGKKEPACSIYTRSGGRCVIFTGKMTTEQYLGHEARHCFTGKFHD